MIDALALAAIARALDHGGGIDAACAALRRDDPLLRGRARRRVRAAYADALLATHGKHEGDGDHALRVAYLAIARAPIAPGAQDDVEAIAAAYDAARSKRPPRRRIWWATVAVTLAIAGGAGAAARWLAAPRAPIEAHVAERPGPAPRGAFEVGGVPAPLPGDAVIRRILSSDVPDFLIALDGYADRKRGGATEADLAKLDAQMAAARDRAVGGEARGALGDGATKALATLLAAARAAALAPMGAASAKTSAVAEATGALDDELAAAGAGYFVDGDVLEDSANGKRLALVYAFSVERVRIFQAGDAKVRALHLRRIDRLNWTHALLGFSRPHLRAAAVLLDQLDEQVLTLVAPGLAQGASVRLYEPEAAVPAEQRAAVEARAGELVREEYGALQGISAVASTKLGDALGKRRAMLERIEARAAARGYGLVVPAKLKLPEQFEKSLARIAAEAELRDLHAIGESIASDASAKAFEALRDALASSVERHEVQHRLDSRSPLPMPEALAARVGPLVQDGRERPPAARARAELSAYLAELARDDRTGRVGLTMIGRFLFDRRLHGSAECYAALAIFEGLAGALAVPDAAPLIVRRSVDRSAVARLYLALAKEPPARIRDAAKRLWEQLFARPLPELRRVGPAP